MLKSPQKNPRRVYDLNVLSGSHISRHLKQRQKRCKLTVSSVKDTEWGQKFSSLGCWHCFRSLLFSSTGPRLSYLLVHVPYTSVWERGIKDNHPVNALPVYYGKMTLMTVIVCSRNRGGVCQTRRSCYLFHFEISIKTEELTENTCRKLGVYYTEHSPQQPSPPFLIPVWRPCGKSGACSVEPF